MQIRRTAVIYVAGPYRSDSEWQVVQNIRNAEAVSLELWGLGYAVICPHKNTALFGGAHPDDVWLQGDLEILRRCDALYRLPAWESSAGTITEVELARTLGLPIIDSLDQARIWIQSLPTDPDGGISASS